MTARRSYPNRTQKKNLCTKSIKNDFSFVGFVIGLWSRSNFGIYSQKLISTKSTDFCPKGDNKFYIFIKFLQLLHIILFANPSFSSFSSFLSLFIGLQTRPTDLVTDQFTCVQFLLWLATSTKYQKRCCTFCSLIATNERETFRRCMVVTSFALFCEPK